ncbi:helicase associated domain-containing protein [Embleya scabrispora]|uniref:helicase associated domain-containing protein n=1 Tax=Embleya scabrispora TaxID=159449 RepID=UPI0039C8717F
MAFDGWPEDVRLGVWITTTRSRGRAKLPAERVAALDALGIAGPEWGRGRGGWATSFGRALVSRLFPGPRRARAGWACSAGPSSLPGGGGRPRRAAAGPGRAGR